MPDVTILIENDHREVERLFAAYATAESAETKGVIVDEIRVSLAQHAAAEEILVYPQLRRSTDEGDDEADHAIDEHAEIKRILADLDGMDPADAGRDAKVLELQRSVEHHVEEEERDVLTSLRAGTDQERLDSMGELFEQMKPLLPTHPHPMVPGSAKAQLLAGPLASVADRIRDFVAR
jgi:Hemerythrin HHE cation binding domain